MEIGLYNVDGSLLDGDIFKPDSTGYYDGTGILRFQHLDDFFSIKVRSDSYMIDDDVAEKALSSLLDNGPVDNVAFLPSDDSRAKKFFRLINAYNGLTRIGRISNDDARSFYSSTRRWLKQVVSSLLSISIRRGLGEDTQSIMEFYKNELLARSSSSQLQSAHLQTIVYAAPETVLYVKYTDPDIEEEEEETLDMALMSCCTLSGEQTVCFQPIRLEVDREQLSRYIKASVSLLLQHYFEVQSLSISDTVLREAMAEQIWKHLEEQFDQPYNYGRKRGNLYVLTSSSSETLEHTTSASAVV